MAISLLLVALAYDWLVNMAHEIIGTVLFVLLVSHTIVNRRWYATVGQRARTIMTRAINLSLLLTMVALPVTSVLISRERLAFLPVTSTFAAPKAHNAAGYLAPLIAAVHPGLHRTMLMGFLSGRLRIRFDGPRTAMSMRALVPAIAAFGACSLAALNVGRKLLMQPSVEF